MGKPEAGGAGHSSLSVIPAKGGIMREDRQSSAACIALIVVAIFNVLSSAVGASALVTVGLPIPIESIRPFSSFLVPGVLRRR